MHLPSLREEGSRERRKGSLDRGSRASPRSHNVLDIDTPLYCYFGEVLWGLRKWYTEWEGSHILFLGLKVFMSVLAAGRHCTSSSQLSQSHSGACFVQDSK